jgi:SET domain
MPNSAPRFEWVKSNHYVFVGENHLGRAVFAARGFEEGAAILRFTGPALSRAAVPRDCSGARDRFMQIDHDRYLGPSGGADDFINHSCDPNAGIRFADYGMLLIALRPIAEGEELCWDYSTTMHRNNWVMRCDCRAASCRGLIGEFESLPEQRRDYYLAKNVVAPYIRALPDSAPVFAAALPRARGALGELHRRVQAFARGFAAVTPPSSRP